MRSPLLILLATSALAFTAACGASDEEAPGDAVNIVPTTSPVQTPVAPTPSTAPSASPAAVSGDWAVFTLDSVPEVTFRYPREWYRTTAGSPSTLTSWDPGSWHESNPPPGGTQVQLDRIRLDDPALERRPGGATDLTVGGAPGWEIVYEGSADDSAPWVHVIAVETKGYRYYLTGSFGKGAHETQFILIRLSFSFR